ncbi:LysM peptidoglycan-binding domain-containing protein [Streptomyces antimicrobicus]|uniref:Transglycosylase family protein n=1 Tax=Streptomyces antimicrobicus TaxID=2883108 RepID=A0ABS8B371_9ACTN|nr:transglycosylase family protein [Streptomyces antimicrobicus]MCB5179059.1 transglycosylase family protein [Streptomyces antimicrobicus]
MRSGNGRHRRPRQVPALVVTAGVTGSALALPLLAATNASAADTATWDKVAECESGGTWSANYGSGLYGGLQLTQEQWDAAGGRSYAERPDLASRSQQIAVAERLLAKEGTEAWELCAQPAGLAQHGPAPEVDPGTPGHQRAAEPSPVRPSESPTGQGGSGDQGTVMIPATPGGPSIPATTPPLMDPVGPQAPALPGLPVMPAPDVPTTPPVTPGGSTAPTAPTAPTVPTAPTTPTAPTAPGTPGATPTAPGAPSAAPGATGAPTAPGAPSADTGTATGTGDSAAGTGRHRGAPAAEAPTGTETTSDPTYTVKPGDSLTAIADAKGVEGGWSALYKANEQVIGTDADLIKPGQNLDVTPK